MNGSNGKNVVNIEFSWTFDSTNYASGDKIRVRMVLKYKTNNADGSAHYEELYLDKTTLVLTESK